MTALAAISVRGTPLDIVVTVGTTYILYRFQDKLLLIYEDLSQQEVSDPMASLAIERLIWGRWLLCKGQLVAKLSLRPVTLSPF